MEKFIFTLSLITFGLLTGYLIQIVDRKKWIKLPIPIEKLPSLLQRIALLGLNPVALIGALWMAQLNNMRLLILPILGALAWILGGMLAGFLGKAQKMTNKQLGAYIVAGSFTNIGAMGGFICFIFFGEIGYAFVPIYKLFEELVYYGIGFPIAKAYSNSSLKKESAGLRFKKIFEDIFIRVALISIAIGLIFNFSGIERPGFYATLNSIIVPIATILLLMSIGINLKFSKIKVNLRPSLLIVCLKMLVLPIIIGSIGYLFGLGEINEGMPLKVVLVLSSMPTGFVALVPPTAYDLDLDLANTVWMFTTLNLVIVLPILYVVTNRI